MKVTLLMAQTLDGKIALNEDHFPDWTEAADKKFFMDYTKKSGVVIMGSKTFDTLKSPLPDRKNIVLTRRPKERTPQKNVVFTDVSPQKLLETLEQEGHQEVVLAGGQATNGRFLAAGSIDELLVTVSPVIFGRGMGIFPENIRVPLTLIDVRPLGEQTLLCRYKILS